MESRIKEVRENRHTIQEIVASDIGITQQMFSKYERDVTCIKIDILIKLAKYFNVTTDYLLGISDIKRSFQGQVKMVDEIDKHFELIEAFKSLDEYDQELLWMILQQMRKTSIKREQVEKQIDKSLEEHSC